jgi:hypothetical protein
MKRSKTRTSGSLTRTPFFTIGVTERSCGRGYLLKKLRIVIRKFWDVRVRRGQLLQRRLPRSRAWVPRPFRPIPNEEFEHKIFMPPGLGPGTRGDVP